jgi:hypothetical protein
VRTGELGLLNVISARCELGDEVAMAGWMKRREEKRTRFSSALDAAVIEALKFSDL